MTQHTTIFTVVQITYWKNSKVLTVRNNIDFFEINQFNSRIARRNYSWTVCKKQTNGKFYPVSFSNRTTDFESKYSYAIECLAILLLRKGFHVYLHIACYSFVLTSSKFLNEVYTIVFARSNSQLRHKHALGRIFQYFCLRKVIVRSRHWHKNIISIWDSLKIIERIIFNQSNLLPSWYKEELNSPFGKQAGYLNVPKQKLRFETIHVCIL